MAVLEAIDPRTGERLAGYEETTPAEVRGLAARAAEAFSDPRMAQIGRRVGALRGAAAKLADATPGLLELFEAESALPRARAAGELARTRGQLELFADVIEARDHLEPIIDRADATATPPRPDLRRMLVPLGPVAIFGASNFPLAFGLPGGDTASALAAGCPALAKGHPSQPGVNAKCARLLAEAVEDAGLPPGSFASVQGASHEIGEALVDAPEIVAVAFTGSFAGGTALSRRAAQRPAPIPVYAEMGSTNPVAITEGALKARSTAILDGLITAITASAGQLCTKPGVVLVPTGQAGDAFLDGLVERLSQAEPLVMLNERLANAFATTTRQLAATEGVEVLTASESAPQTPLRGTPFAATVQATEVVRRPELRSEAFGPGVLIARYASTRELIDALRSFGGQLTGGFHCEPDDDRDLVASVSLTLADQVGRIVFDGFPTGVAVTWSMQHGGPYPATTAPSHTSVGVAAMRRFQRPVCWQDAPPDVLPEPLRDANPDGIWRRVDGSLSREPL